MADPDRKGGGGLSLRTLAIASLASLSAAMVTSRLFPPGTIYTAALTPVLVAAVSEMLSRPVDRVTELRRQRRTLLLEAHALEAARIHGDEPSPLRGAPEFAQGGDALHELGTNGGEQPPITIHGRRRPVGRRILHPRVWVATGLAAFVIAVAALTLPELIFGGAVATQRSTTFFGGGSSSSSSSKKQSTQTSTTPAKTVTQTVPAQTTPQSTGTQTTPTDTGTQTTPTTTGTQTAPSGGAPAPTDTGTSTTPAPPSGAAIPPPS